MIFQRYENGFLKTKNWFEMFYLFLVQGGSSPSLRGWVSSLRFLDLVVSHAVDFEHLGGFLGRTRVVGARRWVGCIRGCCYSGLLMPSLWGSHSFGLPDLCLNRNCTHSDGMSVNF